VTAAHEILGDPERRRQFDAGEIDAGGEARRPTWRPQGAGGAAGARGRNGPIFEDFGDVFSDLFSGGGRAGARGGNFATRGRDVRYTLDVDFLEAVQGAKKRVTLPEAGVLDLNVPEGVTDGQVLRLRGRGEPGLAGGETGDALVEIRVRPHRDFRREGDDILLDLPITLDEAVLGGKVEVPTATGRVQLTIPKGTSSGQVLRLKGKGVRNATTGATGDELVTVRIVLPDTIDEGLSYFLSEWRQKHRYDPRK
jgi:DnaJ-class molecular chaperone